MAKSEVKPLYIALGILVVVAVIIALSWNQIQQIIHPDSPAESSQLEICLTNALKATEKMDASAKQKLGLDLKNAIEGQFGGELDIETVRSKDVAYRRLSGAELVQIIDACTKQTGTNMSTKLYIGVTVTVLNPAKQTQKGAIVQNAGNRAEGCQDLTDDQGTCQFKVYPEFRSHYTFRATHSDYGTAESERIAQDKLGDGVTIQLAVAPEGSQTFEIYKDGSLYTALTTIELKPDAPQTGLHSTECHGQGKHVQSGCASSNAGRGKATFWLPLADSGRLKVPDSGTLTAFVGTSARCRKWSGGQLPDRGLDWDHDLGKPPQCRRIGTPPHRPRPRDQRCYLREDNLEEIRPRGDTPPPGWCCEHRNTGIHRAGCLDNEFRFCSKRAGDPRCPKSGS